MEAVFLDQKFCFCGFFVSCIIFTRNCYAPLVTSFGLIYKLFWLDYGVSLFFFVVTYGLP